MSDRLMTKAYHDGVEVAACMLWATEESCPYPVASKERYDWLTGFRNERLSEQAPE